MNIADISQYKKCIATKARIEQIENLIDDIDEIEEDTITYDEWEEYILAAENLMETLAGILNERANSYINQTNGEQ